MSEPEFPTGFMPKCEWCIGCDDGTCRYTGCIPQTIKEPMRTPAEILKRLQKYETELQKMRNDDPYLIYIEKTCAWDVERVIELKSLIIELKWAMTNEKK